MSLTVPFRVHSQHRPDGDGPAGELPVQVRVGAVQLRSAYLVPWATVLFDVEVLALCIAHEALRRLGVLASISRAAATALDVPLPDSGVLPARQLAALLPWLLASAAALAVLWLLTVLAVVAVHNGICAVTGGPQVRLR